MVEVFLGWKANLLTHAHTISATGQLRSNICSICLQYALCGATDSKQRCLEVRDYTCSNDNRTNSDSHVGSADFFFSSSSSLSLLQFSEAQVLSFLPSHRKVLVPSKLSASIYDKIFTTNRNDRWETGRPCRPVTSILNSYHEM